MKRGFALVAAAVLAQALTTAAFAQSFPNKPVRIVTAFSAGSGPDGMLRLISDRLGKLWGQAVVVDNKPGGSGFIAIAEARKAVPDGHTVLHMDGLNVTAIPHMYSKLPYNAQTDIEPISPIHGGYFFVVVSADAPWTNVADLIQAAKAPNSPVSYGSWQIGSVAHLFGAAMENASGAKMLHVPFKDNSMLYSSVARKDVSWAFGSVASAGALEKAGKLKFLAIAGPTRALTHPNVPTVTEAGGPAGFQAKGWVGLFSIKGSPRQVSQQISTDLAKVMSEPDVMSKMVELGYTPMPMKPDDLKTMIAAESKDFKAAVSRAAIALD